LLTRIAFHAISNKCFVAVSGRNLVGEKSFLEYFSNMLYCFVHMDELSFEWDPRKAASNAAKHGVTFEEAKSVFYDEDALVIPDPDHSKEEERFIIMGRSGELRILVEIHCFRKTGSSIRIISARRAGTKEQKPYMEKKS